MTSRLRSSSLGAVPHKKPLARSRAESSAASPLEVRCACQFFQSDSLIPERVNPIGSRPPSRVGTGGAPGSEKFCSKHNIFESDVLLEEGDSLNFDKLSNYAETIGTYENKENQPPPPPPPLQPQRFDQLSSHSDIHPLNFQFDPPLPPPIEIETFSAAIPNTFDNPNNSNVGSVLQSNANAQNLNSHPMNVMRGQFSSQKSLDRYSSSTLLAKYRQKSQSVAPSLQGSAVDIRVFPRMIKTVSFDYGKPSSNSSSQLNENPNYDQYHRMSPMVFPIRERMQRIERMSVQR